MVPLEKGNSAAAGQGRAWGRGALGLRAWRRRAVAQRPNLAPPRIGPVARCAGASVFRASPAT